MALKQLVKFYKKCRFYQAIFKVKQFNEFKNETSLTPGLRLEIQKMSPGKNGAGGRSSESFFRRWSITPPVSSDSPRGPSSPRHFPGESVTCTVLGPGEKVEKLQGKVIK
jgi:hypothetical protein